MDTDKIIDEARAELDAAVRQMIDRDDQIICDHVKRAKAMLDTIPLYARRHSQQSGTSDLQAIADIVRCMNAFPDMLAALKELADPRRLVALDEREMMHRAWAAIAKAEGTDA